MNPTQLSEELRNGQSPDLTRRRWIIGLSMVTVAAGQIVTLYQTGIIKHLPDPPLDVFNSDKVDASDYGYKRLDTPDAGPMMITGALTATLAAAGGINRATTTPWLPIAMGVKTIIDAVTTIKLGQEEWQENKALCAYCQASTVATLAALALAMPETVKAVKNLLGKAK